MKPIIILLLVSLTLWGCGLGNQSAESNALAVKYDSALIERSLPMLVRQDTPLDSTLSAYLPNQVPPIVENKSDKTFADDADFECEYNGFVTGRSHKDFCRSFRKYTLYGLDAVEMPEVNVLINVHNNSESVKQDLRFDRFSTPEKTQKLSEYKGYKYSFEHKPTEGSSVTIQLPPFVVIRIGAKVVDSVVVDNDRKIITQVVAT